MGAAHSRAMRRLLGVHTWAVPPAVRREARWSRPMSADAASEDEQYAAQEVAQLAAKVKKRDKKRILTR